MSILQISKVQIRRGQTSQTGFPQLSSGEFGWSIDQQQLYIGNGAVSEGAPAVGNTRLLTEHDSNLFVLSSPYVYENDANAASRSLQARLDDSIDVYDYGAVGDGLTDDTDAVQHAINKAAAEKKVLTFNQGSFLLSSTIWVPPFTEIRGAGEGKSNILAATSATLFQTVDGTGNFPTQSTSAANTPQNVRISGLSFVTTQTNAAPMLGLNSLINSSIEHCLFKGNPAIASTSSLASAICLTGNAALTCDNVGIKDCHFQYLGTAIVSDYDIRNINIFENKFYDIDAGIILGKNLTGQTGSSVGPTRVIVSNNSFDTVNKQALFVGTNTSGISSVKSINNSYTKVGIGYNNLTGDFSQATDVITFGTFGSMSSNDTFSRLDAINSNSISSFATVYPVISGPVVFNTSITKALSIPGFSSTSIFAWAKNAYTDGGLSSAGQTIKLDYTLSKPGTTRKGTITVDINVTDVLITDTFSYTGLSDGDLVFSVDSSRSDVILINGASQFNQRIAGFLTYTAYVRQ